MEVKAIACELPNPDYFRVFHSHVNPQYAQWKKDDGDMFFALQYLIKRLHADEEARDSLTSLERRALLPEGVNLEEALSRLVPRVVDANRISKNPTFLSRTYDSATVAESVGVNVPGGVRFVALVKGAVGLHPTQHLMKVLSKMTRWKVVMGEEEASLENYESGMQVTQGGQPVDMDGMGFRCNPSLVEAVRRNLGYRLAEEGKLKLVAIPYDVEVYLSNHKGSEVVKEKARWWT